VPNHRSQGLSAVQLLCASIPVPQDTGPKVANEDGILCQIEQLTAILQVARPLFDNPFADAQDLGAPVYLAKPFDIQDLLREIERLCAGPVRQCA
jgi:hypothetical protein